MAEICTDNAIILRKIAYGETDLIVTCFTQTEGLLSGLAKGAKKSTRRFGAALELGAFVEMSYTKRKASNLAFLKEARIRQSIPMLSRSLATITACTAALELALFFLQERLPAEEKFLLLKNYLARITSKEPNLADIVQHQFDWLTLSGFKPVYDRCIECQQTLLANIGWRINSDYSGVICANCAKLESALQVLQFSTVDTIGSLSDSTRKVVHSDWAGSYKLLAEYVHHLVGKPLKSASCVQSWGLNGE